MTRRSPSSRNQRRAKKKASNSSAVNKGGAVKAAARSPAKRSCALTKGQKFAQIDRQYSLDHLWENPAAEKLPSEQAMAAFIDSYRVRLPTNHPFRDDLEDSRLAPDTLVELSKDHLLFDFAWKLEKLHEHYLKEKKQHERLLDAQAQSKQAALEAEVKFGSSERALEKA